MFPGYQLPVDDCGSRGHSSKSQIDGGTNLTHAMAAVRLTALGDGRLLMCGGRQASLSRKAQSVVAEAANESGQDRTAAKQPGRDDGVGAEAALIGQFGPGGAYRATRTAKRGMLSRGKAVVRRTKDQSRQNRSPREPGLNAFAPTPPGRKRKKFGQTKGFGDDRLHPLKPGIDRNFVVRRFRWRS